MANRSGGHFCCFSRSTASFAARSAGGTIPVDDDTRIEMGAAARIEDPPAPSDTSGTRILPYLYTVFMLLFHGRYTELGLGGETRICTVMFR